MNCHNPGLTLSSLLRKSQSCDARGLKSASDIKDKLLTGTTKVVP